MAEATDFLIETHHYYFPQAATGLPPTHFLNWLVVQINNQPPVLLQTPPPALTTPVMVRFSTRALPSPLGLISATILDYRKIFEIFGKPIAMQGILGIVLTTIQFNCFHFTRKLRLDVGRCEIPGSILNGWLGGQGGHLSKTLSIRASFKFYCETNSHWTYCNMLLPIHYIPVQL